MVPELGFGFFASSNARDGANVIYDLHDLIVPRYFPGPGIPRGGESAGRLRRARKEVLPVTM